MFDYSEDRRLECRVLSWLRRTRREISILAIAGLLRRDDGVLEQSGIEPSKTGLFFELIRLIRTPGELMTSMITFRRAFL